MSRVREHSDMLRERDKPIIDSQMINGLVKKETFCIHDVADPCRYPCPAEKENLLFREIPLLSKHH